MDGKHNQGQKKLKLPLTRKTGVSYEKRLIVCKDK